MPPASGLGPRDASGANVTVMRRDDLRDAFDQPLAAPQPEFVIKTAGLRLTHHHPTWYSSDNAPRQPDLILQFNEPVNETAARQSLRFIDAAGTSVPYSELRTKVAEGSVLDVQVGAERITGYFAIKDKALDGIRKLPIMETRAENFLRAMGAGVIDFPLPLRRYLQ